MTTKTEYSTDAVRSLHLYHGQERYLYNSGALSQFEKAIDRLVAGEQFDGTYLVGGGFYKSLAGYYTRKDGYGGTELIECKSTNSKSWRVVVAVAF